MVEGFRFLASGIVLRNYVFDLSIVCQEIDLAVPAQPVLEMIQYVAELPVSVPTRVIAKPFPS